jgi:diaminopimelate epimerase
VSLRFQKYHGLGNDFIIVDVEDPDAVAPELARRLCDRHFGIGADGVLLVSKSAAADARLVILNADGSRPEMCGNGLRCVALHLERRASHGLHPERSRQAPVLAVETDAGVLECRTFLRDGQRWVTIRLGRAVLLGDLEVRGPRGLHRFRRVSIGNPHAVLLGHDYAPEEIDVLGPEVSSRIDGGANVGFVQVVGDRALAVVVHERGVGRTLACGTGAGAAVAAAAADGLVPFDEGVQVTLPGGRLEVSVDQETGQVVLSGPARHVFDGVVSEIAEN